MQPFPSERWIWTVLMFWMWFILFCRQEKTVLLVMLEYYLTVDMTCNLTSVCGGYDAVMGRWQLQPSQPLQLLPTHPLPPPPPPGWIWELRFLCFFSFCRIMLEEEFNFLINVENMHKMQKGIKIVITRHNDRVLCFR